MIDDQLNLFTVKATIFPRYFASQKDHRRNGGVPEHLVHLHESSTEYITPQTDFRFNSKLSGAHPLQSLFLSYVTSLTWIKSLSYKVIVMSGFGEAGPGDLRACGRMEGRAGAATAAAAGCAGDYTVSHANMISPSTNQCHPSRGRAATRCVCSPATVGYVLVEQSEDPSSAGSGAVVRAPRSRVFVRHAATSSVSVVPASDIQVTSTVQWKASSCKFLNSPRARTSSTP